MSAQQAWKRKNSQSLKNAWSEQGGREPKFAGMDEAPLFEYELTEE